MIGRGGLKKFFLLHPGDDGDESMRMADMFADKAASRCLSEMGFEAIQSVGRLGRVYLYRDSLRVLQPVGDTRQVK